MEFGLLGPLVVRTPTGREVSIKRSKHRQLLAALLLQPNATVSTSLLIDQLWGEQAPRSARANLKTYIWQLRGILTALGPDREYIETSGDGYRIVVRPDRLDTLLFEELSRRGTQALRRGEIGLAESVFSRALTLWRGEVLQGTMLSDHQTALAAALNEERLRVLEDLMQVRLALGRHTQVIGPLRRAVRENPLRERLWAHLMTALYLDGRTSEALRAYHDLRRHLASEIGAEPGPAITELRRRILAADPDLHRLHSPAVAVHICAAPPHAVNARCGASPSPGAGPAAHPGFPAAAAVTPAQLPSDAGRFIGREREFARLVTILTAVGPGPGPVVAIGGPGGIGKSRLAVHVAHAVAAAYPDGQLYVDLHGATPGAVPLTPREALTRFLRALDVPRPDDHRSLDEVAALFRTHIAGRRMLIVLDNAVDAHQVRPMLPGRSATAVIVTSRARLTTLDVTARLDLDVLAEREAIDLLAATAGPERIRSDPRAAARIVELCGRLPLAVRIAGARLAEHPSWSAAQLAHRLATAANRLDELRQGDLCLRTTLAAGRQTWPPRQPAWSGQPAFP